MKVSQTIRTLTAITIAIALGLLALIHEDAAAQEVTVMRHTTQTLPGYGTLSLEIWNDGTDVQVIGLDGEGRIVLAREGTMSEEPTFEGTGAIEGILPAEQLSFDSDGTLEHERCATPSCARGIATVAESIVRASTMAAVETADEHTVMANLCPSTGADDAPVPAPSEAIAALAHQLERAVQEPHTRVHGERRLLVVVAFEQLGECAHGLRDDGLHHRVELRRSRVDVRRGDQPVAEAAQLRLHALDRVERLPDGAGDLDAPAHHERLGQRRRVVAAHRVRPWRQRVEDGVGPLGRALAGEEHRELHERVHVPLGTRPAGLAAFEQAVPKPCRPTHPAPSPFLVDDRRSPLLSLSGSPVEALSAALLGERRVLRAHRPADASEHAKSRPTSRHGTSVRFPIHGHCDKSDRFRVFAHTAGMAAGNGEGEKGNRNDGMPSAAETARRPQHLCSPPMIPASPEEAAQ